MLSVKITSKGQITLPKSIRQYLNVITGDSIDFCIEKNGRVNIVAKKFDINHLYGILITNKKFPCEKMKKAFQGEAVNRYKKSITEQPKPDPISLTYLL